MSLSLTDKKYKLELDNEKKEQKNNKCIKNVVKFYKENSEFCNKALNLISELENNKWEYLNQQEKINIKEFNQIKNGKKVILVLTANEIEHNILLWNLFIMNNKNKIVSYKVTKNNNSTTFNCVCLEKYVIIYKHAEYTGEEYTRRAINNVTKVISPDFIVLLGVCYGINQKIQTLGEVNISERVTGYRINFRDDFKSGDIIFQPLEEFKKSPQNRFLNKIKEEINTRAINNDYFNNISINCKFGEFLSANCLMSCKKVKESIVEKLDNGIFAIVGGEMEACGIFKSHFFDLRSKEFDKWIIIKSICDWGESKNSLSSNISTNEKIKKSIQAYAMMNSCAVLRFLIDKLVLI